jgi:hypothetical protein
LRFSLLYRHPYYIVPIHRKQYRPRPDAVLEHLPYDKRKMLCDWMLNNCLSYEQMVPMLWNDHGIKTNRGSLSTFYRRWVLKELIRRREQMVIEAGDYGKEIERNPEKFADATLDALWQKAWQEARKPDSTTTSLKVYVELLVKLKDQILNEKKVGMMETRLAMLEKKEKAAREAVKNSSKTHNEEFVEQMRQIFKRDDANGTISNGQPTATEKVRHQNGVST